MQVKISKREYDAVLFDMDGVITETSGLHARSWKEVFDKYLQSVGQSEPFDLVRDYRKYCDGKPRFVGVEEFLSSRNAKIEAGSADDSPGFQTMHGIANLKNRFYLSEVRQSGVKCYQSTLVLIEALKASGIKVAVVTASENGEEILAGAKILHQFDAKVDGRDAIEKKLRGKPNPDVFLEAAQMLSVDVKRSIVVEDATSGVEAGKKGGFCLVIGVSRDDNDKLLLEHGADVVVKDLVSVSCVDV